MKLFCMQAASSEYPIGIPSTSRCSKQIMRGMIAIPLSRKQAGELEPSSRELGTYSVDIHSIIVLGIQNLGQKLF